MGKTDEIVRLLQFLQNEGIRVTKDFENDLKKLVQTNITKFAACLYRDLTRRDFHKYNRFEKLSLTKKQKVRLEGNVLWRYEYRNFSNLRCIFVVINEDTTDKPILLCAFNEDGNKKTRFYFI